MWIRESDILAVLDRCCDEFTFPMMDNGYVYLAATRMSLYRSATDWAMVIEKFGFSPRVGTPDTSIQTFASRLHARDTRADYVSQVAYETYLRAHPNDEYRSVFPMTEGPWQGRSRELVAMKATAVPVRNEDVPLPPLREYVCHGITRENKRRVQVFELCRYLAAVHRDAVLATPAERRASVLPEMKEVLILDEWNHPNVVNEDERPSGSETFQQLVRVLATGDAAEYRPTVEPNTHWRNWPNGGRL